MKSLKSISLQKILSYAKPYQGRFNWVVVWAIALSIFAALRPYMLKQTVDGYVQTKDTYGLLVYVGLMGIVFNSTLSIGRTGWDKILLKISENSFLTK